MQYTCTFCGMFGASGERNSGPATYHCHACDTRDAMWPTELAKQRALLVQELRKPISGVASDIRVINELQRDLNKAKESLRKRALEISTQANMLNQGRAIIERGPMDLNVGEQIKINEYMHFTDNL